MPLSEKQEWMLSAFGLIALADRVLTGNEATRVLSYAKGHLEGEEEFIWMDRLTDLDALQAHFATLTVPEGDAKEILEQLWAIALVDGEASMAEVKMLERIGRKLGAKGPDISRWRKSWTTRVIEDGSYTAQLMALLIPREDEISSEDRAYYEQLIDGLPINLGRRKKLLRLLERPPKFEQLKAEFAKLTDERRLEVVGAIARQLRRSTHRQRGVPMLVELAAAGGVTEDQVKAALAAPKAAS